MSAQRRLRANAPRANRQAGKRRYGSGMQAMLQVLLEHVSDGVLVIDTSGRRVFQNRALSDLVGLSHDDGTGPPRWLHPSCHARYADQLENQAGGDQVLSLEWTVVDTTGAERNVAFKIIPVPDANKGIAASLWLLVGDAAQHAQLELALRKVLDEVGGPPHDGNGNGTVRSGAVMELVSRREREVLELLLEGRRTSFISTELGISIHTVRNHLKSMFQKTGTHSQAELIELALQDREPARD